MSIVTPSKREFLALGAFATGLAAPALSIGRAGAEEKGVGEKRELDTGNREAVTPPEDLMREHGVLARVLLLYEAGLRKFSTKEDFDPGLITQSAEVIRDFINNYHEKSEETHVFPRFRKAGQMTDLVNVLLRQHEAGRNLTQTIIRLAPAARNTGDRRRQLVASMQSFIGMYRPHAAREDTDLFPKFEAGFLARIRCDGRDVRTGGAPAVRRGRVRENGGAGGPARAADGHIRSQPVHPVGLSS
jgi:hemerythrin-like domain-containing protein